MKCLETMAHNQADKVIPEFLLSEIRSAIEQADGESFTKAHASLQAALKAQGWQTDGPVAPGLNAKFDALKEGVAVEVEFNLTDYAFREWAYFQKAHVAGLVITGVHIVCCKPDGANCHDMWVHTTLQSFSDVFSVPVLVLGVDL